MKRVLSIDGGGIRGLLPATLLAAAETRDGTPLGCTYDLIAGTSTGGIIACALASGISAAATVALYRDHGGEIFQRTVRSDVENGFGVYGAKYSPAPLEKFLAKELGDQRLSGLTACELLVPTYCVQLPQAVSIDNGDTAQNATAMFFKTWEARKSPERDFFLRDVARCTSAAPFYFPAATVRNRQDREFTCIDGGVFANNPTMNAIAAAHQLWPDEALHVVSLGTGSKIEPTPAGNWGALQWLPHLTDILMDGVEDTVTYMAQDVLGGSLIRCQTGIVGPSRAMDDASPENIVALECLGAVWVAKFLSRI